MKLEDQVRSLRKQTIAAREPVVPDELQGVSKTRIETVLAAIDRAKPDCIDAVYALLDDRFPSWFTSAKAWARFCDGATTAHLACHIGILQRDATKLDREGRDYWVKPLREVGAIEPVLLDSRKRAFLSGHIKAKSPNSAYRLAHDFKRILQATDKESRVLLGEWIKEENVRGRLELQAKQAEQAGECVDTAHANLIRACIEHYVPRFLSGFIVVYTDSTDGERITDEDRDHLRDAGLDLRLGDAMPDVLLVNAELNELWVIEAVTSDGEVDNHKVERMLVFARRHKKAGVGFTTAYATWKSAAVRQAAYKNIPPSTYIWIREDPSKHYRAQPFGDDSTPSTIRSMRS